MIPFVFTAAQAALKTSIHYLDVPAQGVHCRTGSFEIHAAHRGRSECEAQVHCRTGSFEKRLRPENFGLPESCSLPHRQL